LYTSQTEGIAVKNYSTDCLSLQFAHPCNIPNGQKKL
jgi:hypothetical protein